ncbi:MAG: hypothetical protein VB081_12240 [Christensenella sp.]|uniref:hypothetical protein n=1 Tax=Christensenella sp. TaxID=1935934 RepID=UPI002B1EF84E|nr:hypothetical protein [Christensenella sp.]MEA5004255.1 hypothetical protein [Christensenella sp.]
MDINYDKHEMKITLSIDDFCDDDLVMLGKSMQNFYDEDAEDTTKIISLEIEV